MSKEPIVVLIKYLAQPGKDQIAAQALSALVATVRSNEPGCQGITILQAADAPDTILLVEHWSDHATFVGPHMQQPHIQAFMQEASEFLAGPPDISFWRSVSGA